jgi:hypothetical protein
MNKIVKAAVLLIFLSLCGFSSTFAQEAFSSVRLTGTGHKQISNTEFTRNWAPVSGFGFELSTPYYKGSLEAGVRVFRFDAFEFENSGFWSRYAFAGWFYRYATSDKLFLVPGIRGGINFMLHDEEKVYGGEYNFKRAESEFAYEILLRIEYDINATWGFYTSVSYHRTMLNIPIDTLYGTAGVTARLRSPEWLKRVLE